MSDKRSGSLEFLSISQIRDTAKTALRSGFLDLKEYNIKNIYLDEDILIRYVPKVENKIAILSDICQIMAFITSFAGEELKNMGIQSISVEAMKEDKISLDNICVVTPINVAEEIGKGNIVDWLKNSTITSPNTTQKKVFLLVEGPTEINAYPILIKSISHPIFKLMCYPIKENLIEIFPYARHNLKSLLTFIEFEKNCYYVICDKDKSDEIMNLNREGYFKFGKYHILENGEFEDYVEPEILVEILENMNPGIGITIEYIEAGRKKGKSTSKIIQDYYYQFGKEYVFPGKPKLGEEIACFWVRNSIPKEIENIIFNVMNIS